MMSAGGRDQQRQQLRLWLTYCVLEEDSVIGVFPHECYECTASIDYQGEVPANAHDGCPMRPISVLSTAFDYEQENRTVRKRLRAMAEFDFTDTATADFSRPDNLLYFNPEQFCKVCAARLRR